MSCLSRSMGALHASAGCRCAHQACKRTFFVGYGCVCFRGSFRNGRARRGAARVAPHTTFAQKGATFLFYFRARGPQLLRNFCAKVRAQGPFFLVTVSQARFFHGFFASRTVRARSRVREIEFSDELAPPSRARARDCRAAPLCARCARSAAGSPGNFRETFPFRHSPATFVKTFAKVV